MGAHNLERLKAHILPLSVSDNFRVARQEWKLVDIEIREEGGRCPCGQRIVEHCHLKNGLNGNETHVGNVCVQKFLEINTEGLFEGLRRIAINDNANPSDALIDHAFRSGYLYGIDEYLFMKEVRSRRKLSPKQARWRQKINGRILRKTVVSFPSVNCQIC